LRVILHFFVDNSSKSPPLQDDRDRFQL